MFCPKCGAENPAGSRFCGACGAPFSAPAPQPAPQPFPQPIPGPVPIQPAGSFSAPVLVATIALVAGGLCTLFPWVDLNLGAIPNAASSLFQLGLSSVVSFTLSGATSILDILMDMVGAIGSVAGGDLGATAIRQMTDGAGIVSAVLALISLLWVASLTLVSVAAFNAVSSRGSDLRLMTPAGVVVAATALAWIAFIGYVNSSVSTAFSQLAALGGSATVIGSLFSPTPFTWAALLGGLVAVVVPLLVRRGTVR